MNQTSFNEKWTSPIGKMEELTMYKRISEFGLFVYCTTLRESTETWNWIS